MNTSLVSVKGTSNSLTLLEHYISETMQDLAEQMRNGLSPLTVTTRLQKKLSENGVPADIRDALAVGVEALYERINPRFTENDHVSCPCCGQAYFDKGLLGRLELAKSYSGVLFRITAGYRCADYDRLIHAREIADGDYSGQSCHTKGLGLHIAVSSDYERARVLYGLIKAGFNRLGLGRDFIHVDMDCSRPANFAWLYCGGKTGSCAVRFVLIKALIYAGVMSFEIGRDCVRANTYAGAPEGVSIAFA